MKIEEVKNSKFEPFTIKITIENENELRELWCRLNASTIKIKELNYEYDQSEFISDNTLDFFNLINSKCEC